MKPCLRFLFASALFLVCLPIVGCASRAVPPEMAWQDHDRLAQLEAEILAQKSASQEARKEIRQIFEIVARLSVSDNRDIEEIQNRIKILEETLLRNDVLRDME